MLKKPPFQIDPDTDPAYAGRAIVESFAYFATLATQLQSAFSAAANHAGIDADDPLFKAGVAIAADIDAGIGAGTGNHYHNRNHFCEVLLCAVAIANLAALSPHEKALLFVAAVAHDFHHDGRPEAEPFRLEALAADRATAYLKDAGVTTADQQTISALIHATEIKTGIGIARACFQYHASATQENCPDVPSRFSVFKHDAKAARLAVILAEADILPSTGLTFEHAKSTTQRLEQEWNIRLTAENKITFIDNFVGELLVATFFTPNVMTIRQAFLTAT